MRAQLIPRDMVRAADRASMLSLLQSQFDGVTRASFDADLDNKDWVIAIRDEAGGICAFSTLALHQTRFEGRGLWVAFSGDTVVEPASWHSGSIAQAWIPAILSLKRLYDAEPLYWHLISSGYRTYRFLPALARQFYPHHAAPTPNWEARLMEALSVRRFGAGYDRSRGVVRPAHPYVLTQNLRGIPRPRLSDPHIRHFARLNPGHQHGDELVCLTRVAPENLTPLARRLEARALSCEILTGVPA